MVVLACDFYCYAQGIKSRIMEQAGLDWRKMQDTTKKKN
jgi:hypothetical protein